MLTITHLYKSYGRFQAVDDLNLRIEKGCAFGFAGPNGAGKTTTMKIVAGLLLPDQGNVTVAGIDVTQNSREYKRNIGYMPDFFGVYDNLKAIEYMEFYASMYGLIGQQVHKKCLELMQLVHLREKENVYVDALSRGMKQRLCLARALIHDPQLLVLDEPASGLDPTARFEMKEIIKQLMAEGKTIMISSHILPELIQMSSRIGVLKEGSLIFEGSIQEIEQLCQENNLLHVQIIGGLDRAIRVLKADENVHNISIRENEIMIQFLGDKNAEAAVLQKLVTEGVLISEFGREKKDVESVFMQLISGAGEETI